jgi:hypothetical protein
MVSSNHRWHGSKNYLRQYWSLVPKEVRQIIQYFTHILVQDHIPIVYVYDIMITRDDSGSIAPIEIVFVAKISYKGFGQTSIFSRYLSC